MDKGRIIILKPRQRRSANMSTMVIGKCKAVAVKTVNLEKQIDDDVLFELKDSGRVLRKHLDINANDIENAIKEFRNTEWKL